MPENPLPYCPFCPSPSTTNLNAWRSFLPSYLGPLLRSSPTSCNLLVTLSVTMSVPSCSASLRGILGAQASPLHCELHEGERGVWHHPRMQQPLGKCQRVKNQSEARDSVIHTCRFWLRSCPERHFGYSLSFIRQKVAPVSWRPENLPGSTCKAEGMRPQVTDLQHPRLRLLC